VRPDVGVAVTEIWNPDDFMALWEAINKVDPELAPVIDIHTGERIR